MNETTKKTMENLFTKKGKREVVKQILNRRKGYQLATYVRLVKKMAGKDTTKSDIRTCLNHMVKEGQFSRIVIDEHERVFNYSMVA